MLTSGPSLSVPATTAPPEPLPTTMPSYSCASALLRRTSGTTMPRTFAWTRCQISKGVAQISRRSSAAACA